MLGSLRIHVFTAYQLQVLYVDSYFFLMWRRIKLKKITIIRVRFHSRSNMNFLLRYCSSSAHQALVQPGASRGNQKAKRSGPNYRRQPGWIPGGLCLEPQALRRRPPEEMGGSPGRPREQPWPGPHVENYQVAVWNPFLSNSCGASATQGSNLHHQPRQSQRLHEGLRTSQPPTL